MDDDQRKLTGKIALDLRHLVSCLTRETNPALKESQLVVSAFGSIYAAEDSEGWLLTGCGAPWSNWASALVAILTGKSGILPETSTEDMEQLEEDKFCVIPHDPRIAQLARFYEAISARQLCDAQWSLMCGASTDLMFNQILDHGGDCTSATFSLLMHMIGADLALPEKAEPVSIGFKNGFITGCLSTE